MVRVLAVLLLLIGLLLLSLAGFRDWEGRSGLAGLAITTFGGCFLTILGGLLIAKSFTHD